MPSSGKPTYSLLPGPPGSSEALALARRLELPSAWLDRAEDLLGSEHRDLRKLLAEVERGASRSGPNPKRVWPPNSPTPERLRERLATREAELVTERKRLGNRLSAPTARISRRNRRRLREEIEKLRKEFAQAPKVQKGHKAASEVAQRLFADAPKVEVEPEAPDAELRLGAKVRHRLLGWTGGARENRPRACSGAGEGQGLALQRGRDRGSRRRDWQGRFRAWGATDPHRTRRRKKRRWGGTDGAGLAKGGGGDRQRRGRRHQRAVARTQPHRSAGRARARGSGPLSRPKASSTDRPGCGSSHGHGSGKLRQAVRQHLRRHSAVAGQQSGRDAGEDDGATYADLRGH